MAELRTGPRSPGDTTPTTGPGFSGETDEGMSAGPDLGTDFGPVFGPVFGTVFGPDVGRDVRPDGSVTDAPPAR
ncbi:hypothetical protein GCM10010404_00830 [Nonomuraea africana]